MANQRQCGTRGCGTEFTPIFDEQRECVPHERESTLGFIEDMKLDAERARTTEERDLLQECIREARALLASLRPAREIAYNYGPGTGKIGHWD